jgi:cephalosporin-C deacetylase-like acetyl esterase
VTQQIRTVFALAAFLTARTAAAQETDFAAQRALFNYDAAIPLGVIEKGVEKRGGATVRDITFNALMGKDTAAYIVMPEGKGPFAAVFWVHWLGEPETTNRTQFLNEAVKLASQGVVSVLVDTMWSTAVNPDWFGKRVPEEDYANSIKQVVALRRGMDLLLSQPNVDKARVAIVGHDYGGMYSMMMAGVDQRARAHVWVAVVPSLNDWAFLGPQPKSKAAYLRQNAMLELTDYLRQTRSTSTFVQFGAKDVYVSRVEGGMVANAAGTKNRKIYEADRTAFLQKELGLVAVSVPPPPKND